MSLEIVSKEMTQLPVDLLDIAKQHMRVDFTDDDELIKGFVGASIDFFEVFSGLSIFDTEAIWTPNEYDRWEDGGQRVRCPIQPVRSWTATDADDTDVSANYRISGTSFGSGRAAGSYLSLKQGFSTVLVGTGISFAITAGYDDKGKIPPSMLNIILRSAARLYEDRESTTDDALKDVPDWFFELMAGNWVPRL